MDKEFKTIEEQIEILKSRKLAIDDDKIAKDIFRENNYYYVINGYKNIFIEENAENEIFKNGVNLNEIYALYKFDIEIRTLFLKYILSLERRLDTYIAYVFSKNYGHKNYLIKENFDDSKKNNNKIEKLIESINEDMKQQIKSGNRMLNHYMNQYEYVPLWVLIRIITFGQISKFFALMKQKDQNVIAQNFGVKEKQLKTYISNLAIIRNICAHDEKLFDVRVRRAICKTVEHKYFKLELKDGTYCNGFKDLFSIVIILKQLLETTEFGEFYKELIKKLYELKEKIKSVDFNCILNAMGFPENYEKLLEI